MIRRLTHTHSHTHSRNALQSKQGLTTGNTSNHIAMWLRAVFVFYIIIIIALNEVDYGNRHKFLCCGHRKEKVLILLAKDNPIRQCGGMILFGNKANNYTCSIQLTLIKYCGSVILIREQIACSTGVSTTILAAAARACS